MNATLLCAALETLFPARPVNEPHLRDPQLRALLHEKRAQPPVYPTAADVLSTLHSGAAPYAGPHEPDVRFLDEYYSTAANWHRRLTREIPRWLGRPPRLIVEVGSFVGRSTVTTWGPLAQAAGAIVLCIDTWLGDMVLRLGARSAKLKRFVDLDRGRPRTYELFLANVVAHNLTETVFPLPMASLTAARLLLAVNWKVDVVFIDASHEQGETLAELQLYWNLLQPGGVLLGDDYNLFPAVRHDVDLFAQCIGVTVERMGMANMWLLFKPAAVGARGPPRRPSAAVG